MKSLPLSLDNLAGEVAALRPSEAASREVAETVSQLLEDVRLRGDEAVAAASARFDWPGADASNIAVPLQEIDAAYSQADSKLLEALSTTRDNCTFFHRHELVPDWEGEGPQGQKLGIRRLPVERAGLYVPGGLGSYASTVIMNSVPAIVAGVRELVICTPASRDGSVNSSVLTAAALMGVNQVFRVGGAQAVAAMTFGTPTIPRVDVICGPGNAYVMEAKRQVYGRVGIDSLAGPSEVLIVADKTAQPDWVAADLLAQEEHGSGAQAILLAESEGLCAAVEESVERLLSAPDASRRESLSGRTTAFYPVDGADFLTLAEALVNAYAPEHLELQIADARAFLPQVRAAGAIFVGNDSPTAFGDYIAGSNHVLPTGGSARFSSPLSVDTFMRKSSVVEMDSASLRELTPGLERLAESEGFYFHGLSAALRSG